jgi:hypothetical protein
MAKDMWPFRDSQTHSWLSRPWTDVPAEPSLIGPASINKRQVMSLQDQFNLENIIRSQLYFFNYFF